MILSPYVENGEVWLFEDGVVELDYDAHSIALCKMLPPLGSNATFKKYIAPDETDWGDLLAKMGKARTIDDILIIMENKEMGRLKA